MRSDQSRRSLRRRVLSSFSGSLRSRTSPSRTASMRPGALHRTSLSWRESLEFESQTVSPIDPTALRRSTARLQLDRMSLATGQGLGQYTILAPLGAGGMGEVCRARDSRLGRDGAIKVLPSDVARHLSVRRRPGSAATRRSSPTLSKSPHRSRSSSSRIVRRPYRSWRRRSPQLRATA
jgi:hypothetical protein